MTEKRFMYYEHKGADYILDTPNKSLDFIEMLGDCLEAEEIVDLLNEQHETILSLHKTIEELDNCQKGQSHRINDLYLENKQLKDLITHLGYTIKYDGYRHISLELREWLKNDLVLKKSGRGLYYRDGDYEIDNTIQFIIETVEMKLNELYDENEELKKRCDEYWKELGLNNDYYD